MVAKLQSLSTGKNIEDAQRLLNDVAKARLCLCDPKRKLEYDEGLRQQLASKGKSKSKPESVSKQENEVVATGSRGGSKKRQASSNPAANKHSDALPPPKSRSNGRASKQAKSPVGLLVGYTAAIVVIASTAAYFLYQQITQDSTDGVAAVVTDTGEDEAWEEPVDRQSETDFRRPGETADTESETNQLPPSHPDQTTEVSDSAEVTESAIDANSTPAGQTKQITDDASPPGVAKTSEVVGDSAMPALPEPEPEPDSEDDNRLKPGDLERFEEFLGEVVEFEGVVVSANESRSGKTRYLRFSRDWDETIMVFMLTRHVGESLTLDDLKAFAGKRILVSGEVAREFGSNRLGVRVKAKDQIQLVEE
jgi:hypothetical protein